jgi:hypothetical protein
MKKNLIDPNINLDHAYSERIIAEKLGKEAIDKLCDKNLK